MPKINPDDYSEVVVPLKEAMGRRGKKGPDDTYRAHEEARRVIDGKRNEARKRKIR